MDFSRWEWSRVSQRPYKVSCDIIPDCTARIHKGAFPLMELSQIEDKDMSTSVEFQESSAAYTAFVRLQ